MLSEYLMKLKILEVCYLELLTRTELSQQIFYWNGVPDCLGLPECPDTLFNAGRNSTETT